MYFVYIHQILLFMNFETPSSRDCISTNIPRFFPLLHPISNQNVKFDRFHILRVTHSYCMYFIIQGCHTQLSACAPPQLLNLSMIITCLFKLKIHFIYLSIYLSKTKILSRDDLDFSFINSHLSWMSCIHT